MPHGAYLLAFVRLMCWWWVAVVVVVLPLKVEVVAVVGKLFPIRV